MEEKSVEEKKNEFLDRIMKWRKKNYNTIPIFNLLEKWELSGDYESLVREAEERKREEAKQFLENEKKLREKKRERRKAVILYVGITTVIVLAIVSSLFLIKGNKTKIKDDKAKLTFLRTNDKGYKEYKNDKDGSVLIYIPAGEFTMGSESGDGDEKPVHKVYLDGYYIMKYEVTNKQYKKFCDETGRSYPSDPGFSGMSNYFTSYPDYPVVEVNWNDAIAYSKWAGLRLPTEAEWEKAARGTDSRTYPWGNGEPGTNRCNYNNSDADGYKYTSPIGSYENGRSPYGCYDMAGNVWEWCNDWYDDNYYRDSEYRNPKGPSSGDCRILRGGSWFNGAYGVRSAYRDYDASSIMNSFGGFRCSASATKTP